MGRVQHECPNPCGAGRRDRPSRGTPSPCICLHWCGTSPDPVGSSNLSCLCSDSCSLDSQEPQQSKWRTRPCASHLWPQPHAKVAADCNEGAVGQAHSLHNPAVPPRRQVRLPSSVDKKLQRPWVAPGAGLAAAGPCSRADVYGSDQPYASTALHYECLEGSLRLCPLVHGEVCMGSCMQL